MEFGVLIFETTQAALDAEKTIKAAKIKGRIIPTPEQLVASCGFAIKYDLDQQEKITELLATKQINAAGEFLARREGLKTTYTTYKE